MLKRIVVVIILFSVPFIGITQSSFHSYSTYQAQEKAQATHKYIFVSFEASWCQPCQWMKKNVYSSNRIATKLSEDYIAVRSDMTTPNDWSTKYDVKLLPYAMILDAYGNKVADIAGSSSVSELSSFLDCKCQVKADPMPRAQFASYDEPLIDDASEKYWTIQVGKYVGPFYANRLKSKIDQQFEDVHVRYERNKEGKEIYRVFVGYFGDERSANYTLALVKELGYKAFVKFL